jgi:hypothetical protein
MYVIEHRYKITSKKTGKEVELISYFQRHNGVVLSFNVMTSKKEEAKQYEYITEARREKGKYFGKQKGIKVIKVN